MNKIPVKLYQVEKLESDLMDGVYMIHGKLLKRYMINPTGDSDPVLCVPVPKNSIFIRLALLIYTRWTYRYF